MEADLHLQEYRKSLDMETKPEGTQLKSRLKYPVKLDDSHNSEFLSTSYEMRKAFLLETRPKFAATPEIFPIYHYDQPPLIVSGDKVVRKYMYHVFLIIFS
jgi:hypothetical protein